ncbi:hypothetical protein CSB45_09530 [candidate division KSB3 bacterium]|uniref:DUF3108 domain-containing protein n=1 Tax=candidate division KSB3 bacterium TaxID=2044937 RepID=A0A2G6E557_9BACT|nr:MAG: hypothetical protein CSB45_09530 [candidate division KSB3 bacterium]PIE29440.1 MAG: hypothetical protein CSA57_08545 [candidate division KSB3 bacterium]
MKSYQFQIVIAAMMVLVCPAAGFSLGEEQVTVTYKVIHTTRAGELISYAHYSVAAHEAEGYWLQRVISLTADSKPLSIVQILLDRDTHQARRYIMHRPAKMDQPPSVIDLPLDRMGKDEILPMPLKAISGVREIIPTEFAEFDALKCSAKNSTIWLSAAVPVLGVVKVEHAEFTMTLSQIRDSARDLLSQKPPKGGISYMTNK